MMNKQYEKWLRLYKDWLKKELGKLPDVI